MADLSTINAILKHRYETGDYGNCRFVVAEDAWDTMREQGSPAPPRQPWGPNLGALMGIPVVVDAELPDGAWRLVEWVTDTVIVEGSTVQCCDSHNRNCEPPSEMCCNRCTEAAHDTFPIRHADGSTCSAPDLSRSTPTRSEGPA